MIEARSLRFSYGAGSAPERELGAGFELRLDRWTVGAGERWALHGPSGCGKSTLLDLVAGVRVPTSGSLTVAGQNPARQSAAERRAHRLRRVGFVFQDFPLVDYLDAVDNVLLPYRLHRSLVLDSSTRQRAVELLADLGLGSKGERRPSQLSQGERQRVALARALITRPPLLLADEPTAGLDPSRTAATLDLLEMLSATHGSTLLLVTHDPAVLARFEHRLDLGALAVAAEAEP